MHGGKLLLRIVHFLGELRFRVGKLLPGIVHTLGKLCLRLAHLLSEFAVRFLYTVGQVCQTDKRSLGQLLSQLGSLLAQTVEFLEHLGEIECAAYGYDHIADKCRRKQNVDHDQPDKRQTEHQLFNRRVNDARQDQAEKAPAQ